MYALGVTALTHIVCGNFGAASAMLDELVALVDEKGALHWKGIGTSVQGWLYSLTGNASGAVQIIIAGITAYRSTRATQALPVLLASSTSAYAGIGRFDDAWRCIGETMTAIETTKESWFQAEVHRVAGEVALKSPSQNAAKAEAYFERALAVAREQQAKSWNCAQRRVWRGSGAIRVSAMRPAIFSLQSTAGSPRASTRSI
jgi:hypothetical protein